jgi:hypothetical protein
MQRVANHFNNLVAADVPVGRLQFRDNGWPIALAVGESNLSYPFEITLAHSMKRIIQI